MVHLDQIAFTSSESMQPCVTEEYTTHEQKLTQLPGAFYQISYYNILQYVYQPAMLHMMKAFERLEEGLAIFSRFPILTSDYILLYRYIRNT